MEFVNYPCLDTISHFKAKSKNPKYKTQPNQLRCKGASVLLRKGPNLRRAITHRTKNRVQSLFLGLTTHELTLGSGG